MFFFKINADGFQCILFTNKYRRDMPTLHFIFAERASEMVLPDVEPSDDDDEFPSTVQG